MAHTLTRADHLLNNTALFQVLSSASLSSVQEQSQCLELCLPTSSVPTPAWNKCHQKCWMNVIYTSWFLRRSFRTALIIIRRFTVVYYKLFNLHKSLYDGYNPEVHFSILKVTKNIYILFGSTLHLQLFLSFLMFINSCFTCFSSFKKFLPYPCLISAKGTSIYPPLVLGLLNQEEERESNLRFFCGDKASCIKAKQKALLSLDSWE